jgi:hypothetical protein
MSYIRANTDWLSKCRYGIAVHWTAQSTPRRGNPLTFQDAVDSFKLDDFINAILESGAEYLIFTSTHALQMLASPNPAVEAILPGRTTKRDLIWGIASSLYAHGIHLILY